MLKSADSIAKLATEIALTVEVVKTFNAVRELESAAVVTYNGIKGLNSTAGIWKAAAFTTMEVAGAAVCVVFSVADIVLTWTLSNATITSMEQSLKRRGDQIRQLQGELDKLTG